MQDQIGIDQEQIIIAEGFSPPDHQVLEASHLPDQARIPKMGMVIPDIGIAEAGGLQEYIIGAFGEFLQQ